MFASFRFMLRTWNESLPLQAIWNLPTLISAYLTFGNNLCIVLLRSGVFIVLPSNRNLLPVQNTATVSFPPRTQ